MLTKHMEISFVNLLMFCLSHMRDRNFWHKIQFFFFFKKMIWFANDLIFGLLLCLMIRIFALVRSAAYLSHTLPFPHTVWKSWICLCVVMSRHEHAPGGGGGYVSLGPVHPRKSLSEKHPTETRMKSGNFDTLYRETIGHLWFLDP